MKINENVKKALVGLCLVIGITGFLVVVNERDKEEYNMVSIEDVNDGVSENGEEKYSQKDEQTEYIENQKEEIKKEIKQQEPWELIINNYDEMQTIIKQNAMDKWGDNYDMVNYEIERQNKAYNKILNNIDTMDKDILNKAIEKWASNLDMVVYEYNRQNKAKQKLFN